MDVEREIQPVLAVDADGTTRRMNASGFQWAIERQAFAEVFLGKSANPLLTVEFHLWYSSNEVVEPAAYITLGVVGQSSGGFTSQINKKTTVATLDAVSIEFMRRGINASVNTDGVPIVQAHTIGNGQRVPDSWSEKERRLSLVAPDGTQAATAARHFRVMVLEDHGVDLRFCETWNHEAAVLLTIQRTAPFKEFEEYTTLSREVSILGVGSVQVRYVAKDNETPSIRAATQ